MKKVALLIGNSRGLSSTSKDIIDIYTHLLSDQGGAWEQTEIISMIDKPVAEIKDTAENIRNNSYDYVIVYFTGHGGCNGQTILQVNPQNENILEAEIIGLAPKQLNILDCCRTLVSGSIAIDEDHTSANPSLRDKIKKEYDDLINQAAPQMVRLYSCKEGESSYPLKGGLGSVYTQSLLAASRNLLQSMDVVRVYDCHDLAAKHTIQITKYSNLSQTPEIVPAKCLSIQELPISFNPTCLKKP